MNASDQVPILICEDDDDIRTLMLEYLNQMGHKRVVVATNGSEGAFKYARQKFSLLIVDNKLPKLLGLDFIGGLVQSKKIDFDETAVVMVSGALGQDDVKNAIGMGLKFILAKPFTEKQFKDKVTLAIASLQKV